MESSSHGNLCVHFDYPVKLSDKIDGGFMHEAMGSHYFEVSNSLVSGVSGALTYHTGLIGALKLEVRFKLHMPKPPYKSFTK